MHHIKGSVFRTGAPCIGKCFQDGCTPKLTGARAPGAPVLTEPLIRTPLHFASENGRFLTLEIIILHLMLKVKHISPNLL